MAFTGWTGWKPFAELLALYVWIYVGLRLLVRFQLSRNLKLSPTYSGDHSFVISNSGVEFTTPSSEKSGLFRATPGAVTTTVDCTEPGRSTR